MSWNVFYIYGRAVMIRKEFLEDFDNMADKYDFEYKIIKDFITNVYAEIVQTDKYKKLIIFRMLMLFCISIITIYMRIFFAA